MNEEYSSWDLAKKFWCYISEFRNQLILVVILMSISTVFLVYAPRHLGSMINLIFVSYVDDTPFFVNETYYELIIITVLYIVGYSLRIPVNMIMSKISERTTANFKFALHDKLNYLPPSTFNSIYSGNVMDRLNNDVANIKSFVNKTISLFLADVLIIFFVLLSIFLINFQLALIFICTLPLFRLIVYFSSKKIKGTYKIHQNDLGYQMGVIGNNLINRLVIHSFDAKEYSNKKFNEANDIQRDSFLTSRFYTYAVHPLAYLLTYSLQISLYFVAGYMMYIGIIDLATFSTFALYVQLFKKPFLSLGSIIASVRLGFSSFSRVLEILEYPVSDENHNILDETSIKGEIEFKDISYNDISDFNLKISSGEIIALIGSNKDDLIELLMAFEKPDSGEIFLDGENISKLNYSSYRRIFGVSLDDDRIISGSIAENIMYGGENLTMDDVIRTSKLIGLDDLVEKLPDKYDTKLSDDFQNFSSGEAKLICIARAIISNPKVLIISYTNYLDINSLKSIIKNKTVIILVPDEQTIDFADKTVCLE